jgi:hypothetical protein
MLRPEELKRETPLSESGLTGDRIWETVCAANFGDADRLRALIEREGSTRRGRFLYATTAFRRSRRTSRGRSSTSRVG